MQDGEYLKNILSIFLYFIYLVQSIMVERFHKTKWTMTNLLSALCLKWMFTDTAEIFLEFSCDLVYETFMVLLNKLNTD